MSGEDGLRVGYGAALRAREFRALLVSQFVSVCGTSVAAVALTILVYRRTGSPLLASLSFALGFLPFVLGSGLLSSVVDRVRPRRLVVVCDSASRGARRGDGGAGDPAAGPVRARARDRDAPVALERRHERRS